MGPNHATADEPASSRTRQQRGQAMIETLLMTMPIVMLIAGLLQIFLIDEHTFRLASRAHAQLFQQAFRRNSPSVGYATQDVYWQGAAQQVPVLGYFRPFGLSPRDLRIRSVRGGPKRIRIGCGTAPSVMAGLAGAVNPAGWLGQIQNGLDKLNDLKNLGDQLKNPPRRSSMRR